MKENFFRAFITAFVGFLTSNIVYAATPVNSTGARPYAIYGDDNRQEVFAAPAFWQELSRSIAGKVSMEHISQGGGGIQLIGSPLSKKSCPTNRFADQITVPSCTGFLVKENILITAAHCMKASVDCANFVWVFGYNLQNESDKGYTRVANNQVYRCKQVLSRRYEDFGAVDYTIIELDRPVIDRPSLKLGFETPVDPGTPLATLGYPSGLPMKLTDGAAIIGLSEENRTIESNLDVFQGNSGSPVFDAATGSVIAIISRGHADHTRDPEKLCKLNKICMPGDNCHWSSSSRVTNMKDEPSLKFAIGTKD
jgi:V8-like Glu-specific endopeptidase